MKMSRCCWRRSSILGDTASRHRRVTPMYLAIHTPLFGSATVDAMPIECPHCPRAKEHGMCDWRPAGIAGWLLHRFAWFQKYATRRCNPGDHWVCNRCGRRVTINWGLEEPDHLSGWKNSEYCPHRLCRTMKAKLHAGVRSSTGTALGS